MTNVFTFTFDQKTPYHTKIPLAFKDYDHPDEKILLNESFFTFWDFRGDETAPRVRTLLADRVRSDYFTYFLLFCIMDYALNYVNRNSIYLS